MAKRPRLLGTNETLEQKAKRISEELNLDYENVLMGMQMGDIEFQMAIAPYMPKGAKIDPRAYRLHRTDDLPKLGALGFAVPYNTPEKQLKNYKEKGMLASTTFGKEQYSFPAEPDTVNILGTKYSTPQILAHEYRHLENLDRFFGKDIQDLPAKDIVAYHSKGDRREVNNRILDLRFAQKHEDILSALNYLINRDFRILMIDRAKASTEEEKEKIQNKINKLYKLYSSTSKQSELDKKQIKKIDPELKEYFKDSYSELLDAYDRQGIGKSPLFKKVFE